ncbi:SDR family NAD(P)-dependent oxidoreductase [Dactylosporangium sp. NBC_01737]|uniref:SDR family NAD(P)-dependent oxidoreductase n=1 Tax=Dactylosporangium sp. NBC_01737 TaxID=2975959 RepID=UPI002E12318A|nr:SDR family NAD(P)-dependent oxidoreductase [Dactylosporangium sp. NBC_01737]
MPAVVITGTSTGIGRACALTLDAMGMQVFAGVRRREDGDALRAAGSDRLTPVLLDVTDEACIRAARDLVAERVGGAGLTGLVNNAGTTVPCPVEYLPLDVFRRQLEVNLTGHLAVIQAFLPLLRRARGRIVNVSSVGGRVGAPLMGCYAAAKHGLEGLSDSLRLEMGPAGVHVCVVEPGFVATAMRGKLERDTDTELQRLPREGRDAYGRQLTALAATISREAADGSAPEVVARAVTHALTSRRPRVRYPAGAGARRLLTLRRVLPDPWMDRIIGRATGYSAASRDAGRR